EMINHLEKKGLLERDQDPDDGRRTLVWLSTEGRDALSLSRAVLDTKRITTAAARMRPQKGRSLRRCLRN
ncbi:MAG TPA: MarR family transcriptional regulator, partial [Devosia sp.]|nr:MarR family transcriptional regulator [Devosia sp.]